MAGAAFVTDLTEILTQAAEAAGGIASLLNSFDILKISRNYYNLYRDQRDRYISVFRNQVESPLLVEIGTGAYTLDYANRRDLLHSSGTPWYLMQEWWERHSRMYGAAASAEILAYEYQPEHNRIMLDWATYLYRYEEHWFDVRNDIYYGRRFAVHNIGIKQGNAISAALASSLNNFQNQKDEVSAQLATFANGAARYSGYRRGLEDTAESYSRGTLATTPTKTFMAQGWNRTNRQKNMYEAQTFPLIDYNE